MNPEKPRPGLRVLHCPHDVGGHSSQLARAERAIGLRSWSVVYNPHPFGYSPDEVLWEERPGVMRAGVDLLRLVLRAARDFDIVHFNFGHTILPAASTGELGHRGGGALLRRLTETKDARLLRALGKGIVVTFQGDDARQGDFSRAHFPICIAHEVDEAYYSDASDRAKRRRIAELGRLADRIYSLNPDLLRVLPRGSQFLPYASVDPAEWRPDPRRTGSDIPTLLHAPSHRGAKGTVHILRAVDRLLNEGVRFEFRLVEGCTREEARSEYERADLLVDQLLAGWYGGLAVELMALGKPVVCYIREEDLGFIPSRMRDELPVIRATPGSIYDTLRYVLTTGRGELAAIGAASRRYVERWHDPRRIATQLSVEYCRIGDGGRQRAAEPHPEEQVCAG